MTGIVMKIHKAYYRALGYYPMSINGMKLKMDPYHISWWKDIAQAGWEPHTYTMMSKFLNVDSIYCDVGAHIGSTVVYGARICKHVICFEPDPVAYRYLQWNIELNHLSNVSAFNVALADSFAVRQIASRVGQLGNSTTSLLHVKNTNNGTDVLTLTWDGFIDIAGIGKIDLIKIDIEGGEFELLPTLKDYLYLYKPIVYLSTHAPFLKENLRKEKMQQIVEAMAIYKKCLNENLIAVDICELNGTAAQNDFRSYVFMD